MYMLKSYKLNYFIENACCDMINDAEMNSMSICGYKGIICKCILLIVNVYGLA